MSAHDSILIPWFRDRIHAVGVRHRGGASQNLSDDERGWTDIDQREGGARHASGQTGVRITVSDEALKQATAGGGELNPLAVIDGLEFSSGVIEAEISGEPAPGVGEGARGFVGIAFRMQPDKRTYDAFYLRPTNGRADDKVRRNHSAQYISNPAWPWPRLRKESPERYEAYVDLEPGVWTKVKIEVRGEQARLYVHDQPQPTLIINDVKTGAQGTGAVAMWVGPGTIAHFRNVTISK